MALLGDTATAQASFNALPDTFVERIILDYLLRSGRRIFVDVDQEREKTEILRCAQNDGG